MYHVWWPWLASERVARVCQHQLRFMSIPGIGNFLNYRVSSFYYCMWMTHRPNAITHTQEYTMLPGWYDIHLLFSVFSRCQTCAPPDTKSWRRHWLWTRQNSECIARRWVAERRTTGCSWRTAWDWTRTWPTHHQHTALTTTTTLLVLSPLSSTWMTISTTTTISSSSSSSLLAFTTKWLMGHVTNVNTGNTKCTVWCLHTL